MCVQLHGDASFSGQGVVMESLGLSEYQIQIWVGSISEVNNCQVIYLILLVVEASI